MTHRKLRWFFICRTDCVEGNRVEGMRIASSVCVNATTTAVAHLHEPSREDNDRVHCWDTNIDVVLWLAVGAADQPKIKRLH